MCFVARRKARLAGQTSKPAPKKKFNFPPEDPAYIAELRQQGAETRRIADAINAHYPGGPEQYRAERDAGLIKES